MEQRDLDARREWADRFGALTLDTVFSSGRVMTVAGAPYRDLRSLVDQAGSMLRESTPRDASSGPASYHAYHSGRGVDVVVRWDGETVTPCWATPAGLAPLDGFTAADDDVLGQDAALRNVAGVMETQDDDAVYPAITRATQEAPRRSELLQFARWCVARGRYSIADPIVAQFGRGQLVGGPDLVEATVLDAKMTMNLVAQGRWEKEQLANAERQLSAVVDREPEHLEAWLMLCDIPRYGGDPDGSVPRFADLLRRFPDCAEAHYNLAVILLAGDPGRAHDHFARGQELAPDDADYPMGRARALVALGRREQAEAALAEVVALDPHHRLLDQVRGQL